MEQGGVVHANGSQARYVNAHEHLLEFSVLPKTVIIQTTVSGNWVSAISQTVELAGSLVADCNGGQKLDQRQQRLVEQALLDPGTSGAAAGIVVISGNHNPDGPLWAAPSVTHPARPQDRHRDQLRGQSLDSLWMLEKVGECHSVACFAESRRPDLGIVSTTVSSAHWHSHSCQRPCYSLHSAKGGLYAARAESHSLLNVEYRMGPECMRTMGHYMAIVDR